jgi:trigger factor
MNITVDLQPNCRATLHVSVPRDMVKQERTNVINGLAKMANLPGFRPGKVPVSVIATRYKDAVKAELEQALINKGCNEAVKRDNLRVLSVTNVKDQKFDADDVYLFQAELLLAPEVALPEYKGIPAKLEKIVISDEDVEADLLRLRERAASIEDAEEGAVAEKGSILVLNYTCGIDGKSTEETMPQLPQVFRKAEGNWFDLGEQGDFVPGFVDGFIGIKKGEKRKVRCPLPEDFHAEELRGKTLEFDAECTGVKLRKLPELDEEFVKRFLDNGTLDQLREEVRKAIDYRKHQNRDRSLTEQVLKHLNEQMSFELPQELVDNEAQRRTNEMTLQAARQGAKNEDILGMQDQILGAAAEQARQNVKTSFILAEVARREKLQVTESDLMTHISQVAMQSGKQPKALLRDIEKRNLLPRIREDLLLQNALEFLKDQAQVEEVDPASA